MARRVLIADDSALARLVLVRDLKGDGFSTREADSAAAAGAVAAAEIDCAVIDLDLGDGDGATVAETLRAEHPAMPIAFFTSGDGTRSVLDRAHAIGPVFLKPEDRERVVAWVREVCA